MKEQSKVLILTTGRFHVGNLARILSNENFDVTFSCWLPPWHLNRIGLKRQKIKTFFLFLAPILLLTRIV
ncbi:MAG: glycosyltransferase family 1 protein, partial [Gammaproteobacteria bacterium]